MGFNPTGRARVSPSSPEAFGVCARCSIWFNLCDLRWQFQWAGLALINLNLLVCDGCYDEPAPFLKTLIIPADPAPVYNTRPEAFAVDETDFRVTEDGDQRITEDDADRVADQSADQSVFK